MAKREVLAGGLVGLLFALIKFFIGGGTFLEYSFNKWLFDVVYFFISGVILGYCFSVFKRFKRLFTIVLISGILLSLRAALLTFIFSSYESFSFVYLSFIYGIFIVFILSFFVLATVSIIYSLFNQKKKIFFITALISIWIFSILILIEDMRENFNLGGPNGVWYLYGDIILVFGIMGLLIYGVFKK